MLRIHALLQQAMVQHFIDAPACDALLVKSYNGAGGTGEPLS